MVNIYFCLLLLLLLFHFLQTILNITHCCRHIQDKLFCRSWIGSVLYFTLLFPFIPAAILTIEVQLPCIAVYISGEIDIYHS